MPRAQSPSVITKSLRPGLRDVAWLIGYSTRAALELARARMAFARLSPADIQERNRFATRHGDMGEDQKCAPAAYFERIGYVVPRVAKRLPWRTDCLVQALAAQRWLTGSQLASEIVVGVKNPNDDGFGGHAWLVCDGKVIIGGDISPYEPLLGQAENEPTEA